MNVRDVKQIARAWVEANLDRWPGLIAAHLVGGITSTSDNVPFPAWKDVDFHLVFAEGSPILLEPVPFLNIISETYGGILIEAGVKSVAEYASPEAVLANPEIAYHLTVDSTLHDPHNLLRDLRPQVQHHYAAERWLLARVEHERRGFQGALAMRPMVAEMYGPAGEMGILGYSQTFLGAALQVAAGDPPRMGVASLARLGERLAAQNRTDLFESYLAVVGRTDLSTAHAEDLLNDMVAVFDLAVAIRRTPHFFQHKLHAHLRPYVVESPRAMIAAGQHREAIGWITAVIIGATGVIFNDGSDHEKALFGARLHALVHEFGMDDPAALDAKFETAQHLATEIFTLADTIATHHRAAA